MRVSRVVRSIPRITMFTGPQCSLCDEAKEALMELRDKRGVQFELKQLNIRAKDMDASLKKWRRLYQYDIPVMHLNGKQVMKHRVDLDKMEALLRQAASEQA